MLYFFKIEFLFFLFLLVIGYCLLFIVYCLLFIMVVNIDTLNARVELLEFNIQLLMASKVHVKHKRCNAFKLFAHSIRQDVRSFLFIAGNKQSIPKNTDIMKEISHIWNKLSFEEKLHWTHHI